MEEYKNNQAKLDALRGLAEKYDCDMAMVKMIKNLRTAFRRDTGIASCNMLPVLPRWNRSFKN